MSQVGGESYFNESRRFLRGGDMVMVGAIDGHTIRVVIAGDSLTTEPLK